MCSVFPVAQRTCNPQRQSVFVLPHGHTQSTNFGVANVRRCVTPLQRWKAKLGAGNMPQLFSLLNQPTSSSASVGPIAEDQIHQLAQDRIHQGLFRNVRLGLRDKPAGRLGTSCPGGANRFFEFCLTTKHGSTYTPFRSKDSFPALRAHIFHERTTFILGLHHNPIASRNPCTLPPEACATCP